MESWILIWFFFEELDTDPVFSGELDTGLIFLESWIRIGFLGELDTDPVFSEELDTDLVIFWGVGY